MVWEFEFEADLEELQVGGGQVGVSIPFGSKETGEAGYLSYPIRLIPENGRYETSFSLTIVVSKDSRGITQTVDDDISTCEFKSTFKNDSKTPKLVLHGSSDRNIGTISDSTGFLPDQLTNRERYFVTVKLDYPHKEWLERCSEQELKQFRDEFKKRVEKCRNN